MEKVVLKFDSIQDFFEHLVIQTFPHGPQSIIHSPFSVAAFCSDKPGHKSSINQGMPAIATLNITWPTVTAVPVRFGRSSSSKCSADTTKCARLPKVYYSQKEARIPSILVGLRASLLWAGRFSHNIRSRSCSPGIITGWGQQDWRERFITFKERDRLTFLILSVYTSCRETNVSLKWKDDILSNWDDLLPDLCIK